MTSKSAPGGNRTPDLRIRSPKKTTRNKSKQVKLSPNTSEQRQVGSDGNPDNTQQVPTSRPQKSHAPDVLSAALGGLRLAVRAGRSWRPYREQTEVLLAEFERMAAENAELRKERVELLEEDSRLAKRHGELFEEIDRLNREVRRLRRLADARAGQGDQPKPPDGPATAGLSQLEQLVTWLRRQAANGGGLVVVVQPGECEALLAEIDNFKARAAR